MAREYDHLFKLLIIGDSGEFCPPLRPLVICVVLLYVHHCGSMRVTQNVWNSFLLAKVIQIVGPIDTLAFYGGCRHGRETVVFGEINI